MSGCYDWDNSYSDNSWDYNDCHRPRRRHHQKRYDNCWDTYSYSHCR